MSGRAQLPHAAKDCLPQRRKKRLPLSSPELCSGIIIGALAIIFYAPHLLGIATFPDGDFTHHFLPFSMFQRQAMANFQTPLWNPYTYSGHPFWADIQAAALYPVSNALLVLTLPFDDAPSRLYFLQVEAIVHTAAAGYFVYLLARDLTSSRTGGLAAAICFMLSGYLTGYPPLQIAVLRTGIWLPLLLWLLLRAWDEGALSGSRWGYWIGAAVALSVAFLGGHAQTWLYIAYATAGWIAMLALGGHGGMRKPLGRSGVRARIAGLSAFAAISAGLVAAQALPSAEFARLSVRANVDYAYVSGGFAVQDLWNLALPRVLTQFSPLYIGVAGLGLALMGAAFELPSSRRATLLLQERQQRPEASYSDSWQYMAALPVMRFGRAYFVALTLFGLLVSLGEKGFLYPLLYRVAPGWDLFRGQERAAYLATLGLSMLAGYGMALAPQMPILRRRRFALVYGALIVVAVYAFGMLWQLPGRSAVSDWQYLAIAFGTLAAVVFLIVALRLDGWSLRRSVLICTVTAASLFIANFTTNLDLASPGQKAAQLPETLALQEALAGYGPSETGLPGRVHNEYRVYEDYGMGSEVEDVWGSSPLRLARYAQFFDQFPLDRMWRLTGVGYVLTWRRELFGPSQLLGEFPQTQDTTYLHRLPQENPRAWLVENVVVADDDSAWSMLADHEFDLDSSIVLPPEFAPAASMAHGGTSGTGAGQVQAARLAPNRIRIGITGSAEAQGPRGLPPESSRPDGRLLAVSENWMPGWRVQNAMCGQTPCDLSGSSLFGLAWLSPVRANLAFLAIAVPEGDVEFDLIYDPASVRMGLAISGTTVIVLIVVAVAALATTRRATTRRATTRVAPTGGRRRRPGNE